MTPRCLLVGHTAPVTCLSRASIIQDNNYIVSSSEAGEMCTWDLVDGKCRESVKLTQIHTNIQAYHMCNSEDLRLFCNGYYAEILIMDPFSLEILFCLSSKMNPDWISALHVLRPSSRKDDVVLAISITGTVKVWSLLGHENKQSEPIYENESKQIRCLNALSLNCCAYNQRTVLVVCAKYCQIYDAGDFSVLCSIQAPAGERWMSGDFLATDRVLVWSTEGKGYMYKLPANSVPDHKGFHGPTVEHDSPVLFSILAHPDNKLLSCPPAMRFVTTSVGGKQRRLLLRGDSAGVVSLWNVDQAVTPVLNQLPSHAPIVMTSLDMAWEEMNPSPVGILDQLSHPDEQEIKLTASIYLLAANRLVVGREDGSIVIVNATHTVQLQLLHGGHQQLDVPSPRNLNNNTTDALVSTSSTSPAQPAPPALKTPLRAQAHSLTERKCVTLASRHLFPVVSIKWRPADDFMVVACSDGTVYVWQMETGHLDRVLHGMIAEEVLSACDETVADDLGGSLAAGAGDLQGLANPAVHFFRGLRHRNLTAMRAATARGLAALSGGHGAGGAGPLAEPARARRAPLTVQGFRSNPTDWPPHQLLLGHNGRVNCLLYPHHIHHRYDRSHLVSGGIDFAVCLWDLFSGALLHRFCVHAGEITQLIVPPHNCSTRIQKCICSVASDHSVTLLSLTERKCVTLASRHLFPVVSIKWRPADDFMVVACSDGTVYVWQMETGHLDRVLHGMIAEEVLSACDETVADDLGGSLAAGAGDLQGLANPAVHFFRGLRHRNLTAMRAATARGLAALSGGHGAGGAGPLAEPARARRAPLTVQGFRSNPTDPESHILFFDIEGLIVELLSEEYSAMSPASLEAAGLITSEYMKVAALTQSASPDAAKRISGILAKMKEGAETMQTKLQAKAEQLKGGSDHKGINRLQKLSQNAYPVYEMQSLQAFRIQWLPVMWQSSHVILH
ncbi:WD repeat-containing protein 7 [Papilio xuthus]|uniref:WD repeat-containing protein 7 n=1 Tax=Papilio xuthus TaxID=66420 RepID=A0A194PV28_PAPXU|nr:WD repeat-containing protein 7 [Papilio xuthus]